jgi:putative chitinase
MLTLDLMQKAWPHGNQHVPGLIEGIVASQVAVFERHPEVAKPIVFIHALAQFSWECNAGLEMIENLNYSAQGLMDTWPRRFGRATALRYAHNPRMIADLVYGGRMGNAPPPSDDGWNFRGRSLSQLTGKGGAVDKDGKPVDVGYIEVGNRTGFDLVEDPDLCLMPELALEIAMVDFVMNGCVKPAEADDLVGVTQHLNGGVNGLAGRRSWLAKWKGLIKI